MIKTIVFDNHGVLCYNDKERGFPALGKFLDMPIKEFSSAFDEIEAMSFCGEINSDKQFDLFSKKINTAYSGRQIRKALYKSYDVKKEVIRYVEELGKKYEVAILTNFNNDYWDLVKKWGHTKIFKKNKIFVSSDIKLKKPNKEVYEYVLEKLGRLPSEVVFIDDKVINVRAATSVGMHGIVFKNISQFKAELNVILETGK